MHGPWARRLGTAAAGIVALGSCLILLGCGGGSCSCGSGYSITLPDISCTAADQWEVRGLQAEHFTSQPAGELLAATLRRGDVVPLQVTTRHSGPCDGAVARVQWVSSDPEVAELSGAARQAELRALRLGETRVHANVTLRDGQNVLAQLHAVPSPGSPVMLVYAVRVAR